MTGEGYTHIWKIALGAKDNPKRKEPSQARNSGRLFFMEGLAAVIPNPGFNCHSERSRGISILRTFDRDMAQRTGDPSLRSGCTGNYH
jgi:hypothetical protein